MNVLTIKIPLNRTKIGHHTILGVTPYKTFGKLTISVVFFLNWDRYDYLGITFDYILIMCIFQYINFLVS